MLSFIVLSVVMLGVLMLSVVILIVTFLIVVTLSVPTLTVVMLNVVAFFFFPFKLVLNCQPLSLKLLNQKFRFSAKKISSTSSLKQLIK
jgi:hypothetical protein